MRLVVSILLSLGIAFFFALTAQAHELVGGQAKLLKTSELDRASQDTMDKICDNQGNFTMPPKKVCVRVVGESFLSQLSFDVCTEKAKAYGGRVENFLECVQQLGGADYPLEYIKACEKVQNKSFGGVEKSSIRQCLRYLATTSSSLDSEAMDLCFKAAEYHFKNAKPCLNFIRDRVLDTQKMASTCFEDGKPHAETFSCLEKIADASPLSINCGKTGRVPASKSKRPR